MLLLSSFPVVFSSVINLYTYAISYFTSVIIYSYHYVYYYSLLLTALFTLSMCVICIMHLLLVGIINS